MQRLLLWIAVGVCATASLSRSAGTGTADTRAAFLKLIDRARVPLEPTTRALPLTGDGLTQEHVTFAADAVEQVPTLLLKSASHTGRRPVVIVLHGTNGAKEQLLPRLRSFAARGFVAVAIDARYHGERSREAAGPSSRYLNALLRTYRTGQEHPFLYDSVWDVMRLIDYLETREDVDPKRIGLMGVSKGGMETYLTAAVDPRIAAAVPLIGVQSFRWGLEHGAWDSRAWTLRGALEPAARDSGEEVTAAFVRRFYDRVAPGVYGEFDGPAMLPLIAPRPLLVISGDSDPRTPLSGVRESATAAERAYGAAGVPGHFVLSVQPNAGHEVTAAGYDAALDWFVRWLKP